ncbi:MAG: murein biosynthesis integral membrane protein MurJ [Acidobacteria bacterium]|nr:murein biosynthesis integral membrane protein MurJ [Acidobacteriota bacterium]MBV9625142.1 murein biosynthesis integral membrane protein MurJ [Acidobacteriota bacterium]
MSPTSETQKSAALPGLRRFSKIFRPSHQHSALSATVLLATTILLSRAFGFLREMYIAWAFGATSVTDAYNAGFTIPDWLNYLVAGGTASITFVSIYSRFLAENREEEAQKTFSAIVTIMTAVLGTAIVIAEILAPQLNRLMFGQFPPAQFALCVRITRILLPAQLFFYVGGVASAVLLARRMFLIPAIGPLFYSLGIILGGLLFSRKLGISSLAYGGVVGCFVGIFLINGVGAARAGIGYRISFDMGNPAFREWIRLSIPLMLGVSLVTADEWIQRHFAAGSPGAITRLNYARRLFQVPMAVLGQAVGQASLPFFARLFGERRLAEFARTVNRSVYRMAAAALLASSFMTAAALPLVDLVYRRGHLKFADSETTAVYFFWFSMSLAFWSAQSLYARAFYAAGDTRTPMIASTLITLASLPLYSALYQHFSAVGLVVASDLGIAANCFAMALLLNRRGLVPAAGLEWKEIGKTLVNAALAGVAATEVGKLVALEGTRVADLEALALTTLTWLGAAAAGLWLMKSKLPADLRPRGRTAKTMAGAPTEC